MLNSLRLQSVKRRLEYNYQVLMYKILNNLAPVYLKQALPQSANPYPTRSVSMHQ